MNVWKNTHNSFTGYLVDWVMKYDKSKNPTFNKAVENYEKRLQGSAVDYLVGDGEGGILGKIKNKYIHDEQMKILGIKKPKVLVDKEKELIRDGVFVDYPARNSYSAKAYEIDPSGKLVEVYRFEEKIPNVIFNFDLYKEQQKIFIKNYKEFLVDDPKIEEEIEIQRDTPKVIYESVVSEAARESKGQVENMLDTYIKDTGKDFRDYSKKTD